MLNLAIIGVGSWGSRYLIEALKLKKLCKIKYVCSPSILEKRIPGEGYILLDDYKKILSINDIDGVIIATPTKSHFSIASVFIKKNFNVLIEKPPTDTYEKLLELINQSKTSSSIIMVGQIFHFSIIYKELKKYIKQIGKVKMLNFYSGKTKQDFTSLDSLWEWGFHDIGTCIDIVKKKPVQVSAQGVFLKKSGSSSIHSFLKINFSDSTICNLSLGWMYKRKTRRVFVYGTKGTIFLDDVSKEIHIRFFNGVENTVSFDHDFPLYEEIKHFCECIINKGHPSIDLKKSVKIMNIMNIAKKSMSAIDSV